VQESSSTTDNAVAAVAKILKYNSSMIDVAQVLPVFLGWLPTYDDKEESAHIYDYYCDLIEKYVCSGRAYMSERVAATMRSCVPICRVACTLS